MVKIQEDLQPLEILCENYLEVDLHFTEEGFQEQEALLVTFQVGDSLLETTHMVPKSSQQLSQKDKASLAQCFQQRILSLDKMMSAQEKKMNYLRTLKTCMVNLRKTWKNLQVDLSWWNYF